MSRVLIVEDNPELAENMAELLEEVASGVTVCPTAVEALAHAEKYGFDLALVDVGLPSAQSGVDLIPELKRHAPDAEAILVTGNATLDTAVAAVGHGAFAYVLKPFDPDDLLALAERALAQVALREERAVLSRELAASEALYRGVVDTVEALIVGLGPKGDISFCNRFASDITGWPQERAHGKLLAEMCTTPEHREAMRASIREAGEGATVRDRPMPLLTRSGEARTVRWTLTPLHGEGVADPSVLAVGIDITERLELLRRTVESEAMAAMGALTAGLAHEIRNPLNAAKLQLEVMGRTTKKLEEGASRDRILERIEIVQTELSRLSSMLNDFLSLARPRGIQLDPIEVVPLLLEVVRLKRPLADVQRVHLTLERPEAEFEVRGDRGKLKQVILNLVANSLEAMREQGGGEIVLTARVLDGGMAEIEVRDSGPGGPDDFEAQAFQPFYTTKDAGTGLGLTIVKRIVEMHGGQVSLRPGEGGGCVASFTVRTQ